MKGLIDLISKPVAAALIGAFLNELLQIKAGADATLRCLKPGKRAAEV